ncbi:unnamed protein product [Rotaria sp. Silwood2]|nr:unnamed protein product [Rotaria sp. Silwood2]CAF3925864.1 unnamed protein product [Rotaria sp. Silwood2]
MDIRTLVIYSELDRYLAHVTAADSAVALEGKTPTKTYLRGDLIIATAKSQNVEAIIPGYRFLSENANFAVQCEASGICSIGPIPEQIRQIGLKLIAYEAAAVADLLLLPHSGLPLINDGVYLERSFDDARHIEVQIFGDGHGHVIALNERDCSLQRRNQKLVEKTPPPNISDDVRARLRDAAVRLGTLLSLHYRLRIHLLMEQLRDHHPVNGILELAPGVRSLQI